MGLTHSALGRYVVFFIYFMNLLVKRVVKNMIFIFWGWLKLNIKSPLVVHYVVHGIMMILIGVTALRKWGMERVSFVMWDKNLNDKNIK